MAEVLLGAAIEKLAELLIEETKSLKGVAEEVEGLREELEIIQAFLIDVDVRSARGKADQTIKAWVQQVRDKAERILYVVDQYHRLKAEDHSRCFPVKSFSRHHSLASKIVSIKESLVKIKDRAERYGLKPLQRGEKSENCDLRVGSLFVEEDEHVDVDSRELIARLVGGPSARLVLSLVGQGGIGKTTLARKAFEDEAVRGNFDCHAWITVSQSYTLKKLLKLAGSQLYPSEKFSSKGVSVEGLIDPLRRHMRTKKYLVVFDDVWQVDFWEIMKLALPNNDRASRVIVTTRNTCIAQSINETPFDFFKELKTWSPDTAWELFRKRAFRFELHRGCPEELEDASHQILRKCHGLPLVIAVVAGMLSTKEKSVKEWKRVAENLDQELKTNPQLSSILKILSLSYHDLPHNLRSCFLYFGMFPKGQSISERKLNRLWVAEGFSKPKRGETGDQVAEESLKELIHRNLVSVEAKYGFKKLCKVHDLLHDVILSENASDRVGNHRRLSIQNATRNALKRVEEYNARSLFLINIDAELANSFTNSSLLNFKLLKVLNFQSSPIERLPRKVGNLFHLEYLSLKGTSLKKLPKSIGKLLNLLTLDVRNTWIQKLPIQVYKLQKLQHLLAYRLDKELEYSSNSFPGVRMSRGIESLQDLQTLTHVELHPSQDGFIKDLEKLRNLKLLSLSKLTAETARILGGFMQKMHSLEDLSLTSMEEGEVLDVNHTLLPPPSLQYLSLKCRLREFPKGISDLQNLKGLSLRFSGLSEDPLRHVGGLPSLVFLRLYQAFNGEELHFQDGGFRQLKLLEMRNLKWVKRVRIERGALPLLEELTFGDLPLMSDVAFDFERLTSLKSLEISDMGSKFVASLQPSGGMEYWRIEHVRSVRFTFKRLGKAYDTYRLGSVELLQRL